jgi:hypothetical protein
MAWVLQSQDSGARDGGGDLIFGIWACDKISRSRCVSSVERSASWETESELPRPVSASAGLLTEALQIRAFVK